MSLEDTAVFDRKDWPDLGRKPGPPKLCSWCLGARNLPSFRWVPVGIRLCLRCFFTAPRS